MSVQHHIHGDTSEPRAQLGVNNDFSDAECPSYASTLAGISCFLGICMNLVTPHLGGVGSTYIGSMKRQYEHAAWSDGMPFYTSLE
jgi:hypothetical protein